MTRFYLTRVVKIVFAVSTVSFVLIQLQMSKQTNGETSASTKVDQTVPKENKRQQLQLAVGDTIGGELPPLMPQPPVKLSNSSTASDPLTKILGSSSSAGLPSANEIRQLIEENNANADVLNERKFGPGNTSSLVILIQVHNRPKYLEKLVESLRAARDISSVLLIFSHDFYSAELNKIIRQIDFCRVMQIFYPYSIQIFPDKFPGQDPLDCAANIGREKAKVSKCQNWDTPDKYGHYRVAGYTQIKHHWWWKINYVFDGVDKLKNYAGHVLFLEEDHYVSPDFLHVLNYIVKNKKELCQECSIISLGFYLKSYSSYANTISTLAVFPWFSSRHNMGMAFDRSTWNRFRDCAKNFCVYDDYNWDWSLMHINQKCLKPSSMTVIYAKSPRVFHIGDCGIHHKGKQCTADASATKVSEILVGVKDKLFPAKLDVGERSRRTLKAPKENGGWGDRRDHELCLNHTVALVGAQPAR